jgi:acyl-[acyl-carrier-protein]-phospholipid O-acyltransferase/long-chain-fatty-acid--[acyl-carrier-protein] ligase
MTDQTPPHRGLAAHLASSFAGAGIDNVFRMAAAVLFVLHASSLHPGDAKAAEHLGAQLSQFAALVFLAPFVLLAPLAGDLGDRLPKHRIMRAVRLADGIILALGAYAVWSGSLTMIFATLALLGCASAFFGTIKLSAMPELVPPARLMAGNGALAAVTLVAILVGKGLGSLANPQAMADYPRLAAALPAALANPTGMVLLVGGALVALGVAGAWRVPVLPAADPGKRHRPLDYPGQMRVLFRTPGLAVPALSLAGFWGLAIVAEVLLVPIATYAFHLGGPGTALLVVVLTVGIVAGSLLAPLLASNAYPAGLPLAGAALAGLGLIAAGGQAHHFLLAGTGSAADAGLFAALLFLTGMGAGLWDVPMQALLQQRAPAAVRNQAMAGVGVLTSVGMLAAMGASLGLSQVLDSAQVYQVFGGTALALALAGAWLYRFQVGAWLLAMLARLLWDLRVSGLEHLPERGGAVVVANHLSYADGIALLARSPRHCRFLIHAPFLRVPVLGWLLRAAGAIPVDPREGRRALVNAIDAAVAACQAGEVVLVFPEGKLTRSGQLDAFRGGVARIAERAGAPVIPAYLHGLHGTWMSRSELRAPPCLRRRVSVRFGAPLPPDTAPALLRAAVLDLGHQHAEAMAADDRRTLGAAALANLRRRPRATVVTDQGGTISAWRLAGAACTLPRLLGLAADEHAVGVLLPPGRAGAMVNLALALDGRTLVNLNHTAGTAQLARMCELAGVRTIVSSRLYRRRIGEPALPGRVVDAEDLIPALPKWRVLLAAAAVLLLPPRWLDRAQPGQVAALVFSSGSTGDPKGVQLTHRQILAQTGATFRGLNLTAWRDTVLSPLPLFHSFGLVPGLWLGLVEGVGIATHPDPTDAKAIGELCASGRATFVLATPTFVRGWMRRIEPEQFRSLRFAVAGAERCPPELKAQFRERYGSELVEGYGCTELAPVVAINLPPLRLPGDDETEIRARDGSVGRPLPGLSVFAVDPADHRRLPPDSEGLLVVRSPSRMLGYLGREDLTAQAFIADGYATGDIGRVDADGFIHITGRLARFAKVGGEMVPLDHVESAIQGRVGSDIEVAVSAVADASRGERLVVLHTGWQGDWSPLLDGLAELPPLWRPRTRDVHAVESIPRLGTGKRDLGGIKKLAAEKAG